MKKLIVAMLIVVVMVACGCSNVDDKVNLEKKYCIDGHQYGYVHWGYGILIPLFDESGHAKKCEGK